MSFDSERMMTIMKKVFEEPEIEVIAVAEDVICFSTELDPWDEFNNYEDEVVTQAPIVTPIDPD